MYRSDLVRARNDFYDASCPLEDADVCFELLKEWNFGFVHQVLTFTRRQNESIHTELSRYDQQPLLKLMTLLRHGRALLEPAEFDRLRAVITRAYTHSLGSNVVKGIGLTAGFRRFHAQGRACCNFEPSWAAVAGHAVLAAADLLLNPKSTVEALRRRPRS